MKYFFFFFIFIFVVAGLFKAIEFFIVKKNKKWSDDHTDVVDNWKFPSNYL